MAKTVTFEQIYSELKALRRDVMEVKYVVMSMAKTRHGRNNLNSFSEK